MDDEAIARGVGELPRVGADPAFYETLRSAFVSGEIDPGAGAQEAPARAPRRSGVRLWQWLVPVAAAAAAVVVVLALNGGPSLHVLEATGDGYVRVNGTPITLFDRGEINNHLQPGNRLSVAPGATLDLVATDVAMYEVTPGTKMTIPETPGRWFSRAAACSLFAGEIRMKTGPRFPGSRVRVYTPEGIVDVTGTLLSIQSDGGGTCVCVLEGTAHVGTDEADMEPVPPGSRKIMLRDGTVEIIPVKAMHRDGVLDFDRRVGARMDE